MLENDDVTNSYSGSRAEERQALGVVRRLPERLENSAER